MIWGVGSTSKINEQLSPLPRQYAVRFQPNTRIQRRMIAASLKAWNKRDCHPKQAILDSGASDHFLPMSYKGNHETPTTNGITVTCANGGQLKATETDIINLQGLQLVDPLLSLGKLTAHGCRVIFKRDTVEVTNREGLLILVGHKPLGRNIYTVPLPLGRHGIIPRNIPRSVQLHTAT